MKLHNKVAVITGAGSGMGRAMAAAFIEEGAKVVALDINEKLAHSTVDALPDRGAALAVQADVTDPDSVDAAIATAVDAFGRVDILCNNAGILDDYVPAHEQSLELWHRVVGVNLTGPFLMSRRVLPGMLEQGVGVILITASLSSFSAAGGGAAYTASKHGVLGLMRQLTFEYGRRGIRVNAICPGATVTGMTQHLLTPEGRDEAMDAAIAKTPAGRWCRPEEIAKLAVYLASADAEFIHGAAYVIDGGWLAAAREVI